MGTTAPFTAPEQPSSQAVTPPRLSFLPPSPSFSLFSRDASAPSEKNGSCSVPASRIYQEPPQWSELIQQQVDGPHPREDFCFWKF